MVSSRLTAFAKNIDASFIFKQHKQNRTNLTVLRARMELRHCMNYLQMINDKNQVINELVLTKLNQLISQGSATFISV